MKTQTVTSFSTSVFDGRSDGVNSFAFPSDVMIAVNERLEVTRTGTIGRVLLTVVPISYTEYSRLMTKPYKRPVQYQAWRLIGNYDDSRVTDVIAGPNDTITKYVIRYVKRPQAIILSNLEGVTIDGSSSAQDCDLDPILHEDILQRAVELAKAAYAGDLSSQIALGTNSETQKGIIQTSR